MQISKKSINFSLKTRMITIHIMQLHKVIVLWERKDSDTVIPVSPVTLKMIESMSDRVSFSPIDLSLLIIVL